MATAAQTDVKLHSVIRKTQKLLGEHIYKPPLLEKYLTKPPFRFIHDIVCSVISTTGFMKDVFSQNQLKYENVSSPDDKRAFLKKAIELIEVSAGAKCSARPSKILAGKEPEKTNELLQLLAKAISKASKAEVKESMKEKVSPATESVDLKLEKGKSSGSSSDLKMKSRSKPLVLDTSKKTSSKLNILGVKQNEKVGDKKGESAKTKLSSAVSSVKGSLTKSKRSSTSKVLPKLEGSKVKGSSSSCSSVGGSATALKKKSSELLESGKSVHSSFPDENDIGVKRDINSPGDLALPPMTIAEVPLQRPVTRTKFRQGDSSNENDEDDHDPSKERCSQNPGNQSGGIGAAVLNQDDLDEEGENSREEGGVSSSDEVMTDHMNEKISEWRSREVPPKKADEKNENVTGNQNKMEKLEIFKRPVTVIMDNESDEDEEDEMYIVQEKERKESFDEAVKEKVGFINIVADAGLLSQNNRSLLVNQILETQRELEKFNYGASLDQIECAENNQELLREIYLKQIEELKEAIQKITKCANPLANIAQRSQDDACLMEIEYRKLNQENERLQRKIDEAKEQTARTLCPYTDELNNLESCIEKMEGAIALANQRLHMIDEEYRENFIELIAKTPTDDEFKMVGGGGDAQVGDGQHELWGGIPSAEILRNDEEHELKMRKTSMKMVFQRAIDMHEGISSSSADLGKGNFAVNRNRARSKKKQILPGLPVRNIMEPQTHFLLQPPQQRQNPILMRNNNGWNFGGGGAPDNGGFAMMMQSQREVVLPPQQQHYHPHQQFNPYQNLQQQPQQLHYQQQSPHANQGQGQDNPQQFQREIPQLQNEIRPSWWD